jgi:hypothetical protein
MTGVSISELNSAKCKHASNDDDDFFGRFARLLPGGRPFFL